MFASTDEEFMEKLEECYPNEDWDNIPYLDSYPDVYELQGLQWTIYYDIFADGQKHTQIGGRTSEDAIAYLQNQIDLGVRPELEGKKLTAKVTIFPNGKVAEPHKSHFAVVEMETLEEAEKTLEEYKTMTGIIPESLKIVTKKPEAAFLKHFCKDARQNILQGKKVFPLMLP